MISIASENIRDEVKNLWKICFHETDDWLNFYFEKKYHHNNTLVYTIDTQIVASLQIFDYNLKFFEKVIPINYICGICTLPAYRARGFSKELITEAHKIIAQKNVAMSILIPANENLFGFYEKFGYKLFFNATNDSINLRQLISDTKNEYQTYQKFCAIIAKNDICILKSFQDFKIICEENRLSNYETKRNCYGMAKIFNIQLFDYQEDILQELFLNSRAALNFMLE
jgi:predicted acetyltransferase